MITITELVLGKPENRSIIMQPNMFDPMSGRAYYPQVPCDEDPDESVEQFLDVIRILPKRRVTVVMEPNKPSSKEIYIGSDDHGYLVETTA